MRKLLLIGLIPAVALGLAGVAVARLTTDGTTSVSAAFSATTAQSFRSRSCSGPDGQYQLVDAVYTGTSTSSDANLGGDARIRIQSVYNTTEKTGWATGWLKLRGTGALRFEAVNSNGTLSGLAHGRVGRNVGTLLSGFTASFSPSGVTNGQLGGGGSTPNVGVLAGRICTTRPVAKSVHLDVKGTIDSISDTSLTVAPEDGSSAQTCAIGPGSPKTSGFAQGERVRLTCATVNSVLTVVHLRERG
jgi:hypothetical protein